MLAVIQWEKCGDMRGKAKAAKEEYTDGGFARAAAVWYVGAGVVSGAGFCSINNAPVRTRMHGGMMQLKATVYERRGAGRGGWQEDDPNLCGEDGLGGLGRSRRRLDGGDVRHRLPACHLGGPLLRLQGN